MTVKKVVTGDLEENCYIISEESSCLVVDPGADYEKIKKELEGRKVLGVLITHYHFDHIGALDTLLKEYDIPVYDYRFSNQSIKELEPFHFLIIPNKGHTKDSVRFVFEQEQMMFVGDFVFASSIGRCDLEGGNYREMKESIEELLKEKNDYTLYPGHGETTTLDIEKRTNPYF